MDTGNISEASATGVSTSNPSYMPKRTVFDARLTARPPKLTMDDDVVSAELAARMGPREYDAYIARTQKIVGKTAAAVRKIARGASRVDEAGRGTYLKVARKAYGNKYIEDEASASEDSDTSSSSSSSGDDSASGSASPSSDSRGSGFTGNSSDTEDYADNSSAKPAAAAAAASAKPVKRARMLIQEEEDEDYSDN